MAPPDPILHVDGIHTYYGDSYVLQGMSLSVAHGTIVAILGRNGMGKTTLIRSVAGLTPPRTGAITYRGRTLAGLNPYDVARLGMALVPQGRRTFPSLTVRENLLLSTSSLAGKRNGGHGRRPWTLDAVYREFPRLAERQHNLARHLSGGEQQMLAIGRALMANPDLILMDEPSEGLAPLVVRHLGEIMRRLRDQGHSILVVEQNFSLAMSVAEHIYVIASGRNVFDGTPAQLSKEPEILNRHLGI